MWGAPIFHLTELWFTTHNIVSKLTESYKMTTPAKIGRPKKPDSERTISRTVTWTPRVHSTVAEFAAANDLTFSAAARELILTGSTVAATASKRRVA